MTHPAEGAEGVEQLLPVVRVSLRDGRGVLCTACRTFGRAHWVTAGGTCMTWPWCSVCLANMQYAGAA